MMNYLVEGLVLSTLLQMIRGYHSTNPNYVRNPLTHGRGAISHGSKRADAVATLYELAHQKKQEKLITGASSSNSTESSTGKMDDTENDFADVFLTFLLRWVF